MSDAHLEDLFSDGEILTVTYPGKPDIDIWITRPDVMQQKDMVRKGRAAKARRKQELMNKDGDERLALDLEVDDLTKADLVERLVEREAQDKMQQATNEVMFNPDIGSDWGTDAEDYLALVDATLVRLNEIKEHNDALDEADVADGRITPIDDEELNRLGKEQERFNEEVKARYDELIGGRKSEIALQKTEDLRTEYRQGRIELECDMAWFEEYRKWQLYYACRFADNHTKLYFSKADKVIGLPPPVRGQIMEKFDAMDISGADAKNLLTSLSS